MHLIQINSTFTNQFKVVQKMKIIPSLILILISNLLLAQTPEKVLFIGNSMTYFNDMPIIFKDIAISKGKNVTVQVHAPGGTGFINHVSDNSLYNIVRNNTFDIVIMQPGTSESGGASSAIATTANRGLIIMDSIKKYSPCPKFFIYEISNGIQSANNYANYFVTQTRIKDSISKMADIMRVPFIPAGECARNHYTASPDLLLHNSYGDVHPNLNGSFLVAAAAFAAIYQENVTGSTSYSGVNPAIAQNFQQIADNIVLNNLSDWRINTYNLNADFNFISNNFEATFTNNSTNYDTLIWDFGDGSFSSLSNPTHTYLNNGNYNVTITATKNGCSVSKSKLVAISNLNINVNQLKDKITFFPNPFNDKITINSENKIRALLI